MLTAVTGINWGDEGKGRVIDLLAENADVVARYQGGNNAGHTVVTEKGKFILNLLPSGILHPDVTCVLGTGMVIDLDHLAGEMQAIEARGVEISPKNLKLSDKATISMPWHKVQDGLEEDRLAQKGSAFGSTRRGIAYAYSDKYRKKTLRLGDLLHLDEERTQNRLHMILDSKNMELAGCYHQEQDVLRCAAGAGAEHRRSSLHRTSAMWGPFCRKLTTAASASCWKPSWVLCGTLITASSRLRPAPIRWQLTHRWGLASPTAASTMWWAC